MNVVTALILGTEIGALAFCAATVIGWKLGDQAGGRDARAAVRRAAADGFYTSFLAYRLGHRAGLPLRFEQPSYIGSRTWGDA
ncbi:hypothetical protein [Streptomyces sp. NPDC058620]|uniref:hypothetical protein n=1 Tax=Streptomyces sp. NPDC058620 TaxID=3346560 RepID=UPI00365C051D